MGKLKWNRRIAGKIIDRGQRGLIHSADVIYSKSQELAPFDDGELTLGARITQIGEFPQNLAIFISYGNDNVSKEYAVIQHEDLSLHHSTGQAKFLETAFNEMIEEVPRTVADYIREVL